MPLYGILEVQLFNVWGTDFLRPFVSSNNNLYIWVAVDYVSKWVEIEPFLTNDDKALIRFLKKTTFTRFAPQRSSLVAKDHTFATKPLKFYMLSMETSIKLQQHIIHKQTDKPKSPIEKSKVSSKRL